MSKYKYLLFDADNTLFDFSQAEYNAFGKTCAYFKMSFSDELYKAYSVINDGLWKQLEIGKITLDFLKVERFRKLLTEKLDFPNTTDTFTLAERWRDMYMDSLSEQSCLIEGAYDVCKSLFGKYKMYIITNGIGSIQKRRFTPSEIFSFFDGMFISEEIGVAKPSTKYFDYVLNSIGDTERSKYLVIGDSLTSDVDGAIGYGLDICFYNPKRKSTDGRAVTYDISKLSALLDILA